MFKSFDTIKAQLAELAPAINAFKSEAVQLRIVELIFSRRDEDDRDAEERAQPSSRREAKRPKKARGGPTGPEAAKGPKRRSGSAGPVVTLAELIDGAFFAKHRTLGDIIEHCRNDKAKHFRADQLSGPLARFVRDGRLKRQKNGDGQYEYWK